MPTPRRRSPPRETLKRQAKVYRRGGRCRRRRRRCNLWVHRQPCHCAALDAHPPPRLTQISTFCWERVITQKVTHRGEQYTDPSVRATLPHGQATLCAPAMPSSATQGLPRAVPFTQVSLGDGPTMPLLNAPEAAVQCCLSHELKYDRTG